MGYCVSEKPCEWCKAPFMPERENRGRFCGMSCAAKWRMSQPHILKKIHTVETHRKIGAAILGQKHPTAAAWHRENNCMFNPDTSKKVSNTLKRIGHKPKIQGGNGRGPTKHEKILAGMLGVGWEMNHVVVLEVQGRRHPYKIDIANPQLKIAIEVDGQSHASPSARLRDSTKQSGLEKMGWKVLRFKNREVEQFTICKLKTILHIA